MKIKVCGLRDAQNIKDVSALGVDMIGLDFIPNSPRFVPMVGSGAGFLPDYAEKRTAHYGERTDFQQGSHTPLRVGVFADDMPQNIVTRVYNYGLDYVQLNGEESAVMCENLRRTLVPDIQPNVKLIKTLRIRAVDDFQQCREYEGAVDLFLFDTAFEGVAGAEQQLDGELLNQYNGSTPFLWGGKIGPEDAEKVLSVNHPLCVGININSRFETQPAVKDVETLRVFIQKVMGS